MHFINHLYGIKEICFLSNGLWVSLLTFNVDQLLGSKVVDMFEDNKLPYVPNLESIRLHLVLTEHVPCNDGVHNDQRFG